MKEMPETDPETILKSLELELVARRIRTGTRRGGRTAFRAGSLILVLLLLAGALFLLQIIVSNLPRPAGTSAPLHEIGSAER
jgi:hypothetical protein